MAQSVIVFAPHPDDAEFYAGGTIAWMAHQGITVYLVTVSDGRMGSFTHTSSELIRMRAEEARQGARLLGAEEPIFLGHADSGLDLLPAGFLREQFTSLIRQHRPDIVIAEDIFAAQELHPDHRAVARAVSDALSCATLPLVYPEHLQQGLEPHFVREKYFYAGPLEKANKIVNITTTMPIKLAAISAHKTQVEFLVEDVMRQARLAELNFESIIGAAFADPLDT